METETVRRVLLTLLTFCLVACGNVDDDGIFDPGPPGTSCQIMGNGAEFGYELPVTTVGESSQIDVDIYCYDSSIRYLDAYWVTTDQSDTLGGLTIVSEPLAGTIVWAQTLTVSFTPTTETTQRNTLRVRTSEGYYDVIVKASTGNETVDEVCFDFPSQMSFGSVALGNTEEIELSHETTAHEDDAVWRFTCERAQLEETLLIVSTEVVNESDAFVLVNSFDDNSIMNAASYEELASTAPTVRFAPLEDGDFEGELRIHTNDSQQVYVIEATGTGFTYVRN